MTTQLKSIEQTAWDKEALKGRNRKPTKQHTVKTKKGKQYLQESIRGTNLKNKTILNIAGGYGREAQFLLENGAKEVALVDLSGEMLKFALYHKKTRNLTGIELIKADAENLPFTPNSFSYGYIAMAMHHLPNHEKATTELLRTSQNIIVFDIMNPLITRIATHLGYNGNEGEAKELKINRVNAKKLINTIKTKHQKVSAQYYFDFDTSIMQADLIQSINKTLNIGLNKCKLGSVFGVLAIIKSET